MPSSTLPITSLCSSTFSSRLYLDCNSQQIIRIATILLTCSICSSFSFSSSTNAMWPSTTSSLPRRSNETMQLPIIWFGEALFACIILYWPHTKNSFMMMGRSSSLNFSSSAFRSTTSRHLTTLSRTRMDISDNQPVWFGLITK